MNQVELNKIIDKINETPQRVMIVAVTKYSNVEEINNAINAGIKAIAENRIEIAEEKFPFLLPAEKHFIGRIQSKKIKKIVDLFDIIQSVGSIEHLKKINESAKELNKTMQVLLQFNISEENQKDGFKISDINQIEKDLNNFQNLENIKIIGVMGMASHNDDSQITHKQFKTLREIRDQLNKKYQTISELSMGMSEDYKIALKEGATMIRIGSLLFK